MKIIDYFLHVGPAQGERSGAGHQAGAGGHRPAGDHQGDIHHAAVRQSLRGQILWQLLQKYRFMGRFSYSKSSGEVTLLVILYSLIILLIEFELA